VKRETKGRLNGSREDASAPRILGPMLSRTILNRTIFKRTILKRTIFKRTIFKRNDPPLIAKNNGKKSVKNPSQIYLS
jgi:hypothetical protein